MAGVKRRGHLPFGEELSAGMGERSTAQGYGASDNARRKFTGYEQDAESGLDYAQARQFVSMHGRVSSADPLMTSLLIIEPRGWNGIATRMF